MQTLLPLLAAMLLTGCEKKPTTPSMDAVVVKQIAQNTAQCDCGVKDDGGVDLSTVGVCWSTSPKPTVAGSKTERFENLRTFTASLTGLTANTTYYARAYATNSEGTGYGPDATFTTLAAMLPNVSSSYPHHVTTTTAQLDGEVFNEGGAPATRGVCWSTSATPTIADSHSEAGTGVGVFTADLTGLTANTTYYARAYATNEGGTRYGDALIVKTMYGTVTDIDGNVYQTVLIGTQEWMAENLKVTHYRTGDPIANITNNTLWSSTSSGAWCSYNNDPANATKYGLLYNHLTVTDSKGLGPAGWHVPSDAEWTTLASYLGGADIAGYKMKRVGQGIDADNSCGFTALFGGRRDFKGGFDDINRLIDIWSTTPASGGYYVWQLNVNGNGFSKYDASIKMGISIKYDASIKMGISIRCVKG